jgi:hypothetical protein
MRQKTQDIQMKVMISPKTDVIFLAAVKCCVVLDQENGMQALSIEPVSRSAR